MKIKTREERKQWLEEKRKKKEENNVLSLKNKRKNEYLSKEIIKKKIPIFFKFTAQLSAMFIIGLSL